MKSITWTLAEASQLYDAWKFNCGPAAICAVTGLTPAELRPSMGDFESKGYTNPTLMREVLARLGVKYTQRIDASGALADVGSTELVFPSWGLVRVQWDGPWCKPGVPMAARYRQTHWVAADRRADGLMVFDVNATHVGGWLPFRLWVEHVVPWILKELMPKSTGKWWFTHALEIER
jgi:hypothetical protein